MSETIEFTAPGKLLITGEYTVLRGALALAVPTKFKQRIEIKKNTTGTLRWLSKDYKGNDWFSVSFGPSYNILESSDVAVAKRLAKILTAAQELNPSFDYLGLDITTFLEFHREWGLGSSSTLITLIAKWADVDAIKLFFKSLTGSGYDVATAVANAPILYQLINGDAFFKSVEFNPPFKDKLFFVYLGKKKKSDKAVKGFEEKEVSQESINAISELTKRILDCENFEEFENLLLEHEALTSILLNTKTTFESRFPDYPNVVKSLGAWGGDFVLATGPIENTAYFKQKGHSTILSWNEMIGT